MRCHHETLKPVYTARLSPPRSRITRDPSLLDIGKWRTTRSGGRHIESTPWQPWFARCG
jgi:hypothetical protein